MSAPDTGDLVRISFSHKQIKRSRKIWKKFWSIAFVIGFSTPTEAPQIRIDFNAFNRTAVFYSTCNMQIANHPDTNRAGGSSARSGVGAHDTTNVTTSSWLQSAIYAKTSKAKQDACNDELAVPDHGRGGCNRDIYFPEVVTKTRPSETPDYSSY